MNFLIVCIRLFTLKSALWIKNSQHDTLVRFNLEKNQLLYGAGEKVIISGS